MGIQKLNNLTKNAQTYEITPNTIIIDGNNMIINYLTSSYASLLKTYPNAEWRCIDMPIIKQFYYLYTDTVNFITKTLTTLKKRLTKGEHNVIVVFDPVNPVYRVNGDVLNLKELEQQKRKSTQSKKSIKESIIEQLKLQGRDDEIEQFDEQFYYAELFNLFSLIPIIINSLDVDGVLFIQAKSEADLVIANLAACFSYSSVLIMSMDTDYFVLTSDMPNVYKTDIKLRQDIFYPYELWRTVFGEDITFDDIAFIATLSGNDYTAHASIMSFDVVDYQNFINHNTEALKRKKKIKYIETPDDLEDLFKISYDLYHSITQNFEFDELKKTNTDDLIKKYVLQFENTHDENAELIPNPNDYLTNLKEETEFDL